MEKLISNSCNFLSVPESYVLPPEIRPGELPAPPCTAIPVVDLRRVGGGRKDLIQQIIWASEEFGFFQLTGHGVSEELMHRVLTVSKEFFELPAEEKARFYSEDPQRSCRLYTSINFSKEKVHFWRDKLQHSCHPLEDHIQQWPENPASYREVVGNYSVEMRRLSLWLLDLIGQGLGLEPGFFRGCGALCRVQKIAVNHYPRCPDPSLTLGLAKHCDASLITLLNQGTVAGLQVLKDEQWFTIEPLPNALVVNIGYMLQIISNGKLKSAEHRVVTNTDTARTTVASFIDPSYDSHIEPAKGLLVKESSPQLYKAFTYRDFVSSYVVDVYDGKPPLDRYMLQS
ncbi:protein DOWNY MILDEW RESISTANCE 6-like [Diospyros lotus]|uniref:protein DOWNY MILDEW RESISTANCE 6-like n=1 Tax=Diospyros lotus TaxID=55363 RepID=UPI002251D81A|nr:protein DOWNY MILDEW RESISTANCE 6-like [Diospyros lotus]